MKSKSHKFGPSLYEAAKNGFANIVELLLKAGGNINYFNRNSGFSILRTAIENGHVAVVETLLEKGVLITTDKKNKRPYIYLAARDGHTNIVIALLKRGARFNDSYDGITPLSIAAKNGYAETVNVLLESGKELSLIDDIYPATDKAIESGHMQIFLTLLEKIDPINLHKLIGFEHTTIGFELINHATQLERAEIVKILLAKGASPFPIKAELSEEPLAIACKNKDNQTVMVLLKAYVSRYITDNENKIGLVNSTSVSFFENGPSRIKILKAAHALLDALENGKGPESLSEHYAVVYGLKNSKDFLYGYYRNFMRFYVKPEELVEMVRDDGKYVPRVRGW